MRRQVVSNRSHQVLARPQTFDMRTSKIYRIIDELGYNISISHLRSWHLIPLPHGIINIEFGSAWFLNCNHSRTLQAGFLLVVSCFWLGCPALSLMPILMNADHCAIKLLGLTPSTMKTVEIHTKMIRVSLGMALPICAFLLALNAHARQPFAVDIQNQISEVWQQSFILFGPRVCISGLEQIGTSNFQA